nr:unnamed protein product [Digitaria exilis]
MPGLATSGRITRSKAAANGTVSGVAPSLPPLKTEQKHGTKGKMKRKASDENASSDAGVSAPHPKRRAVLENVTNIRCVDASKKCTAVTKLQSGPSHKVGQSINKQCASKVPKLLPLAVGGSSFVNDSNSAEETRKVELLAQKKKQIVLVENKGALPLQNTERIRDSACHEAFFEERNASNKLETACHEAFFEERNARKKLETASLKAVGAAVKKNLYFVTGGSGGLNIVDIDKDNGDPRMCVTYVAEIYRNLMALEVNSTYQQAEVLELERKVLNDLGFYLSVPTTKTFLRRFLGAAQASCIELQHNTSDCPLKSVREKYRQQKFSSVANLRSPELPQSLFL